MLPEGVPIEVFDARRFPHRWREAGFDDTGWGAAQVVPAMHIGGFARTQPPTDPYGPLYPRPIAQLGGTWKTPATVQVETLDGLVDPAIGSPVKRVEAAAGFPVSTTAQAEHLPLSMDVPAGGTVRLILDMGGIVSGLVEFELEAAAGTVFDLSYVEEPVTGPAGMIAQHAGTRYIARGEHDRFEVFDPNGFRYAYILVHGAAGTVTLAQFHGARAAVPLAGRRGLCVRRRGAEPHLSRRACARCSSARTTSLSTAPPASSAPGSATASSTRWCISQPTGTGGWPGTT